MTYNRFVDLDTLTMQEMGMENSAISPLSFKIGGRVWDSVSSAEGVPGDLIQKMGITADSSAPASQRDEVTWELFHHCLHEDQREDFKKYMKTAPFADYMKATRVLGAMFDDSPDPLGLNTGGVIHSAYSRGSTTTDVSSPDSSSKTASTSDDSLLDNS